MILGALWNLFLLLLPFFLLLVLHQRLGGRAWSLLPGKERCFVVMGLLFALLFFPNIPYVMTDARHMVEVCTPSAYNLCNEFPGATILFFAYGSIALPFFYLGTELFRSLMMTLFGKRVAVLSLLVFFPLISIGVLLGLFDRVNSWDFFSSPLYIIVLSISYFLNLDKFLLFITFLLSFVGIYGLFALLFSTKFLRKYFLERFL